MCCKSKLIDKHVFDSNNGHLNPPKIKKNWVGDMCTSNWFQTSKSYHPKVKNKTTEFLIFFKVNDDVGKKFCFI